MYKKILIAIFAFNALGIIILSIRDNFIEVLPNIAAMIFIAYIYGIGKNAD